MGPLLLVGGHEQPRGEVLSHFARVAGDGATVALVTTATEDPEGAYRRYRENFLRLGCGEVLHVRAESRQDAAGGDEVRRLSQARGIFFSGGDQLRITSLLGGTEIEAAVRSAWRRGAVVGGTSAGASAMSATMLVGGMDDASARREAVRMCPGLGLLESAVVDQHFAQRGRINRLLSALSQNPGILGIGIDEDTAILVTEDGRMEVLGSGTVTILDACAADLINASETDADAPLAFGAVGLWVLPSGYLFDFAQRRPMHKAHTDGEDIQAPAQS